MASGGLALLRDRAGRDRYVAGAFAQRARENTVENVFDPALVAQLQLPVFRGGYIYFQQPFRSTDTQVALFGQADWRLSDVLKLTLGLRFTHARFDGEAFFAGPVVGEPVSSRGRFSENPVTPKIGISYRLNGEDLLYATIAKGYRIGGANAAVGQMCAGLPRTRHGTPEERARLDDGDGHVDVEIVALAAKQGVRAHVDHQVEIAARVAGAAPVSAGEELTQLRAQIAELAADNERLKDKFNQAERETWKYMKARSEAEQAAAEVREDTVRKLRDARKLASVELTRAMEEATKKAVQLREELTRTEAERKEALGQIKELRAARDAAAQQVSQLKAELDALRWASPLPEGGQGPSELALHDEVTRIKEEGAAALRSLELYTQRFPGGLLAEEAQAARLDALLLLDHRSEALQLLDASVKDLRAENATVSAKLGEEWDALQWKHLDHHLRQFGV